MELKAGGPGPGPGCGGASARAVLLLLVGLQCLHAVVALKSQLFTRGDPLDYPSRKAVDYKTFYFNQKVSF